MGSRREQVQLRVDVVELSQSAFDLATDVRIELGARYPLCDEADQLVDRVEVVNESVGSALAVIPGANATGNELVAASALPGTALRARQPFGEVLRIHTSLVTDREPGEHFEQVLELQPVSFGGIPGFDILDQETQRGVLISAGLTRRTQQVVPCSFALVAYTP